ncbi:MAG: DoxX family protein [Blastocatellia bacterium]
MNLKSFDKYRDHGLLLLRVGIGLMFITVHGWPKLAGGVQMWTGLGKTFNSLLGFSFIPVFWGLMATLSEFGGGWCLVSGALFRPACVLMLITMSVAVAANIRGGYGFAGASQAFEMGVVFLSLIFIGPGRFTLPQLWRSRKR